MTPIGEYLKSGPKFAVTYMYIDMMKMVQNTLAEFAELSKLTVAPLYKDRVGKYLPA